MYFSNALFGLMLFWFQNHFSSLSSATSVYCLFSGFSFLGLFIVVRIGTVVREVGFLFTKASYSIAASDRLYRCSAHNLNQPLPGSTCGYMALHRRNNQHVLYQRQEYPCTPVPMLQHKCYGCGQCRPMQEMHCTIPDEFLYHC